MGERNRQENEEWEEKDDLRVIREAGEDRDGKWPVVEDLVRGGIYYRKRLGSGKRRWRQDIGWGRKEI